MSIVAQINLIIWVGLSVGGLLYRGLIKKQWSGAADCVWYTGVALLVSWLAISRVESSVRQQLVQVGGEQVRQRVRDAVDAGREKLLERARERAFGSATESK